MGTLEPIRAGRARRRASCWSILEAMTWNLNAYSRASAGVGWLGRGAGGPVTPPVARSSSARLPPGPPAASARMPTRGQRRARARPCRRPCQPLIACLPVGMQARHPHSARSAWAARAPPPSAALARDVPAAAAACPRRRARGSSCAGRMGASCACPASACCGGGTAAARGRFRPPSTPWAPRRSVWGRLACRANAGM